MRTVAYLIICMVALVTCDCASSKHTPHQSQLSSPATTKSQAAQNIRNNSYSLLYELLSEEKDVSKILLIKHEHRELNRFIKDVAKTSGAAATQMAQFRDMDGSLALDATHLPPGEVATRDAIAGTKTKALLGSSGNAFERALLLTQIEALNYAAHLAKVGAAHDSDPHRSEYMQSLGQTMNRFYLEAIELLPPEPRNR